MLCIELPRLPDHAPVHAAAAGVGCALHPLRLAVSAARQGHRRRSATTASSRPRQMADQLLGVLREVVAAEQGKTITAQSTLFTADPHARIDRVDWRSLPAPRVAAGDPAAGYLAIADGPRRARSSRPAAQGAGAHRRGRVADRARADRDRRSRCGRTAAGQAQGTVPRDWRINWYRGVSRLAGDRAAQAERHFEAVYRAVPGELAPQLALGITAELTGAPVARCTGTRSSRAPTRGTPPRPSGSRAARSPRATASAGCARTTTFPPVRARTPRRRSPSSSACSRSRTAPRPTWRR